MTNDEVIKLAREAWGRDEDLWLTHEQHFLERFAALVAAAEREECIKLCEAQLAESDYAEAAGAHACVEAIRARGRE